MIFRVFSQFSKVPRYNSIIVDSLKGSEKISYFDDKFKTKVSTLANNFGISYTRMEERSAPSIEL